MTSTKTGGLGYGILIAVTILEANKSSIRFERKPDGGLIVTAKFPGHATHNSRSALMPSENNRSQFLIRLIDDEEDVLNALQILLESAGWKTKSYCRPGDFLKDTDSFRCQAASFSTC